MQTQETKTTCPYCGVGCGVIISQDSNGNHSVKGDPQHPANLGLLCSKGSALAETLSPDGRLLYPEIDGNQVSWDEATTTVSEKLNEIVSKHGSDAVAFYVSGQLLTEDYYVANKLMKGFIGSGNIDTNSRLCMSSAVAGQKRAFGSDTVPGCYEDLEHAELIILVGSNTAWCHPVIFQRIAKAKKVNPDLFIVVIDPRETATTQIADMHLAINPGTDQDLFNGLIGYMYQKGRLNEDFIAEYTEGFDAIIENDFSAIDELAETCQLPLEQLEQFYLRFMQTERVVTLYSQGINQWSYGTDRVNSIINVHLATGRIGRPGMGPFSITGQPNAMGGREVGGLSNQLAAHMDIKNSDHHKWVKEYWNAPNLTHNEGLKAVDLFKEVKSGKIKAIWIMATNPAVSLPESSEIRAALEKCEVVIVSDCVRDTDTTQYANILLPAQTWGERDGTVTNSERCISRQRAFTKNFEDAKPDWWIICQVAKKMGFSDAFDFNNAFEIFKEHAALSGLKNNGSRDFDISGLSEISVVEYENMQPVQWPVTKRKQNGVKRMFSDKRFFTVSGKAQFIVPANRQPAQNTTEEYPYVLNTGRVRDQWHTMTRTSKSPRLLQHISEPFIEIHPDDAKEIGLKVNQLAVVNSRIKSRDSEVIARVKISNEQKIGNLFIPIHWSNEFSAKATVGSLITSNTDPFSGQPEFKYTPVKIRPFSAKWYGFIISRRSLDVKQFEYWTRTDNDTTTCYEIAGKEENKNWNELARELFCIDSENPEWIEYHDPAQHRYRAARIQNGMLDSCIFIGPDTELPDKSWLLEIFDNAQLEKVDRMSILSGKTDSPDADKGPIICSCFSVGLKTITHAIMDQGLVTVDQIGKLLHAGTNCGSCKPELQKIIDEASGDKPILKIVK